MRRSTFLLCAALVALAVGSFALMTPTALLATSFGYYANYAITMREAPIHHVKP